MPTSCNACGSDKIIPDVQIRDQGQNSSGRLEVVVHGKPAALLFKDALQSELRAQVCGECGHTELKVEQPNSLYKTYQESLKNK